MKGYDKEQARAFILARIDRRLHRDLSDRLEELVARAIDADIAYMHACGALDGSGDTGEGYYDEDDAFEYILDALVGAQNADDEDAMRIASLLSDFVDAQQAYLESAGLVALD